MDFVCPKNEIHVTVLYILGSHGGVVTVLYLLGSHGSVNWSHGGFVIFKMVTWGLNGLRMPKNEHSCDCLIYFRVARGGAVTVLYLLGSHGAVNWSHGAVN
jgi:NAD-dependent oxidoreductase involved in siderophore biosynthesis